MVEDTTDTQTSEDNLVGLSYDEVAERVADGRVNINTDVRTKSVGRILAEHTFTFFNAVNLAMACLVAVTQQWRNMLFMGVVLANMAIGVFQEIRAKRMVDRLTILSLRPVTVIRAAQRVGVGVSELVIDDLVCLSHGDQIPADSIVVRGNVTVNESLLTGESKPVAKGPGSELLSGSFVDSGSLVARVVRVGSEGYAARINAEAKYVKPVKSEILSTLDVIIRVATMGLVPLGAGLFLRTLLMDGSTINEAILASVAAVIGMIPQGLVLLTSSVLAIATTRLAMRKVLVQQSYCVETLARVDTLCLDKTGTITTGGMEVARVTDASLSPDGGDVARALATIARATADDANETARAVLAYTDGRGAAAEGSSRVIPFTSARKYSGCVATGGRALVMGAAQFVLGDGYAAVARSLASFDELERVLVVCEADGFAEDFSIMGEPRLLGFVAIRDQIRDTAPETMRYFARQGVELRVISGDDPRTVSAIAARAGVPDAGLCVDASTLDTDEKIHEASQRYRVFGRVTPQQKRELVRALHAEGRIVAMTGDGVNDVLALREADCSVSMASGSAAARNVSEIVLADNDFAHMPEVVAEGRRSINNL
jgi:cation-transporting ATPase E